MKYFNIPADFKMETIDKYDELNQQYSDSKVIETYGQITLGNRIGSGRAYDLIPKLDITGLQKYIDYSAQKNIGFNYTMNTTCMGNKEFTKQGINEILGFLDELYAAGVRSLTVTLPSMIEIIRLKNYDFEIKASTVCQIINANKALAYKNLGVDKIVIDESINRDFEMLKRIRNAFGEKVEVITNVICHKNCIYEMFHHNQTSHDDGIRSGDSSATYYSHRCMMKRSENFANIMKLAWIRPEDLKYYTGIGINYFKLQGRQAILKGDPVRATKCYFEESFDGNLMDLLDMFSPTNSFNVYIDNKKLDGFLKPFYEKQNFCNNDCTSCRYCESYARRHTEYEKVQEMFDLATDFYQEFDQFTNMVKESSHAATPAKPKKDNAELNKIAELNFEF